MRDVSEVKVRQLCLGDFLALHRLYNSLSDESKFHFHPGLMFSSKPEGLMWFLVKITLLLSLTPLRKFLLLFYPKSVGYKENADEYRGIKMDVIEQELHLR